MQRPAAESRRRSIVVGLVILGASAHAVPIASTFDTSAEGWTSTAPTLTYQAAGGNPGGYLRFVDDNSTSTFLDAPPAFLGDLSAIDGVGAVWFDVIVFTPGTHTTTGPMNVVLSGPGGTAVWVGGPDAALLIGTGWTRLRARLVEAEWRIDAGSWDAILANVTLLRIAADPFLTTGPPPETMGFDNIRIAACPTDANGDNRVNFGDLNAVLSAFGQDMLPGSGGGDFNNDHVVDFADLNAVLTDFGSECN